MIGDWSAGSEPALNFAFFAYRLAITDRDSLSKGAIIAGAVLQRFWLMKNPLAIMKKSSMRAMLLVPVIGFLAFTGCSSIDGTATRNQASKTGVNAAFVQSEAQSATAEDNDPDPGYEWFY